jgi:plasmid stabilization system protein ParE
MKYEVKLTGEADRNNRSAFEWYADRSPDAAALWYRGIMQALTSLESNPQRCALAKENEKAPIELRQLNYGSGRRLTHRIIFAIRPNRVVVYAVRHVAQRDWEPGKHED